MDLNRSEVVKALEDDDTFAFTLVTILLAVYGEDTFNEDPEVLLMNLEEDFGCKLSQESRTRIYAALTAMTTDLPYVSPEVFNATVLAFTEGDIGDLADGGDEEIDGSAALWTVTELGLLNDDGPSGEAFGKYAPAIHAHVGKLLHSVAMDMEEIPDDVDTLEEASDEPYFVQRVNADLRELARQLLAIGADRASVKELLASNGLDPDVED